MRYLLVGLLCLVGCNSQVRYGKVLAVRQSYVTIVIETQNGHSRDLIVPSTEAFKLKQGDTVRFNDYGYLGQGTAEQ